MISFIGGTLLKEKPFSKFMLKHDIKDYYRQFTKILSFVPSDIQHTDFLICNYI